MRAQKHPALMQLNVLHALALHDIKSRFFGNAFGYLITILWASTHIIIIMCAYIAAGRLAPYGSDRLEYVAICALPYICWSYISKFCMLGSIQNKSFLQYPVIKLTDLIWARIFLEIVSCIIITICLISVLTIMGVDVLPRQPEQAVFGLMSAIYLGVGFGYLGSVISAVFPLFNILYVILLITYWMMAGVAFDPEGLPQFYGNLISWICPLLHSTEWIKTAYYPDYPARLLDKSYVLLVASLTLTAGLLLEKIVRRYV